MRNKITVLPEQLKLLRTVDEGLVSYNVEMTEVTGGTFWKEYTKEQIDGTEDFPQVADFTDLGSLMQVYPPIDLGGKRIRSLASALGPVYIRVSGSWATNTYYDFDGHTGGIIPEGFQAVLTEKQWRSVLDFVKAVDGKLLISVANCVGVHKEDGSWDSAQAKLLFDYSKNYGVPIDFAEFMNEPNMAFMDGMPKGYDAEDFGRDQDAFFRFVRENYPETKLVGPCACGDTDHLTNHPASTIQLDMIPTRELLDACTESADIFSYHCYTGVSERGAVLGGHWNVEDALTSGYLDVPANYARYYASLRDKYCPGAPMWVTESGDAGCGGNTWASTFLEAFRTADEFGSFTEITDGVIFHNTLASSDYGYLDHKTHLPRPNYWVALLWSKLMGSAVYETNLKLPEAIRCYAHSRKDGKPGYVYLLLNTSASETMDVEIPWNAERYTLSARGLRTGEVLLNGRVLEIDAEDRLPELEAVMVNAGVVELKPHTITFLVL